MKLGKKIGLAFGAVTLITAVLGITAYIMFGRVSSEVNDLSEHSLPKVQHSTGVERAALNILTDQKDYHIEPKQEYVDKGHQDFVALGASLDEVDKIASKFQDTALTAKAQEIRKGAADWQKLFDQFVSESQSAADSMTTLADKGKFVMDSLDAYKVDAKLGSARAALDVLDGIDAYGYDARDREKTYLLTWKPGDLDRIHKDISVLVKGYDDLANLHPAAAEQQEIADARKATQQNSDAFEKAAQAKKVDTDTSDILSQTGEAMMVPLENYKDAKSKEMADIVSAKGLLTEIEKDLLSLRYENRVYQITNSDKAWEIFLSSADDINKIYGQLLQITPDPADQAEVATAQQGTADYIALSRKTKDFEDNVRMNIIPAIRQIAAATAESAQSAENDAWKASAQSRDAVAGIVSTSKAVVIGALVVAVVASVVIGFLITMAITKPARLGVGFASRMAEGDLTQRIDIRSKDELGDLMRAMDTMGSNLRGMFRQIQMNGSSVGAAAQELSAVSAQVSSNSEETSAQSNVVAAAAEQVSKNINTVATAAEELSASVREIAQQTTNASKVASEAVDLAERTNETISKLGESSTEVGNVIKVITTIAAQTNLLALNATIEAARAGESGKGFAVVANEVKELARQTALASNDISQKIGTIQNDSVEAVRAIQAIGGIIKQINEIQTSIAGAVEEQAVTTSEISRNVNEAALGSSDIAKNIASVSEVASNSTQAASSTAGAANELARLASDLNEVVGQFKLDDGNSLERAPIAPAAKPEPAPAVKRNVAPAKASNGNGNGNGHHHEVAAPARF